MSNVTAKTAANHFYQARCKASTHNEQLSSREGAADLMSIDRGRLYRILMGLYQKGWLQFDMDQESYSMHPAFAQFIYEKYRPKMENHLELIELCKEGLNTAGGYNMHDVLLYISFAENIIKKVDMGKGMRQVEFVSVLAQAIDNCSQDRHEVQKKIEYWYKQCLKILVEIGAENQIEAINIYEHMAKIYSEQKEYEKAKELYEKSIELRKGVSGEIHRNIATSYEGLALIYWLRKDYTKAEELCSKSAYMREQMLGICPITINSYDNLAEIYCSCENYAKAEELYLKIIDLWEILSDGKEVDAIAEYYNNLASVCYQQGKIRESLDYLKKAYVTFIYGYEFGCNPAIGDMIYKNMEMVYTEWNPGGNFEQWLEEKE